ncbi:MAG: coproporphyrinogen III oxidase family protein [Phycisphaerae bacterium]|jgi:oxygen-independent coproporphyrinogen-3 oxidase
MQLDILSDAAPTEIGSYFVANYPPFHAWRPEHVPAALSALATPRPQPAPLGLYVHIPFCRKRCKFCYFRVYTDKNAEQVETYLDALAREIALYKRRAALAEREFEFVYFGGGTPSFLSTAQLERLVERINRSWRWEAAREVTFECEPGTLKENKVRTIRRIGVTRLSLGVEHFDDEILEHNGRAHRSAEIHRAWDWIRSAGFDQVNIDLIAGLAGETDAKWSDVVAKALALAPDSVTIYQMELPRNTTFSRELRAGGGSGVASWERKRAWVEQAFRAFERAGYTVSSAYTLVRSQSTAGASPANFVYRDSLWRGADMLGTGVASFSHLGGVHFQNADQWDDYLAAVDGDAPPIRRALPMTPRQRLIRELVLQLKLGRIDAEYFRAKFEVEIISEFAAAFDSLCRDGLAAPDGDRVTLTRAGLLRVDALLPRFFEPEFQNGTAAP